MRSGRSLETLVAAVASSEEYAAFSEGGWYGPAPAHVAPVPAFKAALQRLCGDEEYLREKSAEVARRTREYVKSREFGLSRTLERIMSRESFGI